MKKRINANLKSPAELAQRLQDGEVFWYDRYQIWYDNKAKKVSPFRYGDLALTAHWHYYAEMEIEVEPDWRDEIGDGVLCWVWDGECPHDVVRVVKEYDSYFASPYSSGARWKNAKPLTLKEAKKYIFECRK